MKRPPTGNEPVSPSGGTTPQQRKDAKREAAENAKSATSEKLDWLDALCIDPRLRPSDFKVAFKLIQFRNAQTGICNPSYETIADETGLKPETVRACVKQLSNRGWIAVKRPNRSKPNVYRFLLDHVNGMLDRRIMLREAREEERKERATQTALQAFDRDRENGVSLLDRDENDGRLCELRNGEHVSDHLLIGAGNKWSH
ncbi:helix-turn-helix domain-containing protein [Hoeflea alexandrii]|uniref:Helix-turn-helix domain-containing protein n=1 Tax=Hoeflea alexandrii TaxID=288436 RepID=A0ABT1CSB5_9HYPH|nr:helix-turn-helix domain-containing protein [Hoeflea alexandrii]MCO6409048.1 hypothetical protein [Hoeflea alexandrii]MCY0151660.1 helix-turn-helix domain-containing protein [Hoeflea alexandrii]